MDYVEQSVTTQFSCECGLSFITAMWYVVQKFKK